MAQPNETAPSPRQPFNRQGVQRIPGFGWNNLARTGNSIRTNKLKIGTINLATLKGKEEELIMVMKNRKLDILALAETRTAVSEDKIIHDNYRLITSSREDGRHGVGILISPGIAHCVERIFQHNERVVAVDLKLEIGLSFIQLYAPQQGRPVNEKDQFYAELQDTIEKLRYQDNLILAGDWNGHVGTDRNHFESVIGAHGVGTRNIEGQRIIDFALLWGLSVMNTFYQHRNSHKWTWYRYNNQLQRYTDESMIDLFLTNNRKLFMNIKAIPSVSMDADHRLVVAEIRAVKPRIRAMRKYKPYRLNKLEDQESTQMLKNMLQQKFESAEEGENVETQWNIFRDNIKETADEVIGRREAYRGKKKSTPWWTAEVKEVTTRKMKMFRKWMKTRRIEDRQTYIEARNIAERVKREAKRAVWVRIGEDLRRDLMGTKKLIYSMSKNYRGKQNEISHSNKDKQGNILTRQDDIADRWREYFEEHLNVRATIQDELVPMRPEDYPEEDNMGPITMEELKDAISRMKNGKAPGCDEIPSEIIKAGGEVILAPLLVLLREAYSAEQIPSDWQKGIICPIYKKGDKTLCDNHRGVTLISHVGKIYNRIIERRVRSCVEHVLQECQYGFRPGRSTTDLLFTIKMLLEKSWEWNIKKFALFIDLEKAFDRINRDLLWNILSEEHYNIPSKLIRVVKNMYSQCSSKVRSPGNESRWFNIDTGVRQGDVLSPLLFVIFMDRCIRDLGPYEGETLMYADDVAVVADTINQVQDIAGRWYNVTKNRGMKMNTNAGKTELMVIAREEQEYDVYVGEDRIGQSESYNYLGVNLNNRNLQEVEINKRIGKYNSNVGMMYHLLRDRNVPRQSKLLVYNSILKPILLYGSEAWSLTTKTKSRLQAAEMRVLRLIKGVTRRDRLRNISIREDLKVTPLLDEVENTKLRWYGHVKRMEERKMPKKYLEWTPPGKRSVGRPRKRWMDGIKESMLRRGTSLSEVEETSAYDDRREWRTFLRVVPADR